MLFGTTFVRRLSSFPSGSIAVVTGGASGIGKSVSNLLAKEGVSVVVADSNAEGAKDVCQQLATADGLQHTPLSLNVKSSESVKACFDQVMSTYKRPATILVNSAGITRDAFMLDMTEENFNEVMDVNLKGTFLTTKLACKLMIEHGAKAGAIVNLSSTSAKIGNMGQCNYSASKSAVESFSRSVAREMGKHNIRCNVIAPSMVETPIIDTVPEKIMQFFLLQTPLRRLGKPEEIAEAIVFLASPRSSYVTGATLQVSGGFYS